MAIRDRLLDDVNVASAKFDDEMRAVIDLYVQYKKSGFEDHKRIFRELAPRINWLLPTVIDVLDAISDVEDWDRGLNAD